MTMIRASDFCRRPVVVAAAAAAPPPPPPRATAAPAAASGSSAPYAGSGGRVGVRFRPLPSRWNRTNRNSADSTNSHTAAANCGDDGEDDSAVAYTASTALFRRAGCTSGAAVWLEVAPSGPPQRLQLSPFRDEGGAFDDDERRESGATARTPERAAAVVVARLMYDSFETERGSNGMYQDDDELVPPVVYLSPVVAANLGIQFGVAELDDRRRNRNNRSPFDEEAEGRMGVVPSRFVPTAAAVRLRYWGKPVRPLPLLPRKTGSAAAPGRPRERPNVGDLDVNDEIGDSNDKNENPEAELDEAKEWPLPRPGRLVQEGCLIVVSTTRKQGNNSTGDAGQFYYEIVEVTGTMTDPNAETAASGISNPFLRRVANIYRVDHDDILDHVLRSNNTGGRTNLALTTRRTRYTLEAPPVSGLDAPQLPSFLPAFVSKQCNGCFRLHPDTRKLVQLFLSLQVRPSDSARTASECIFHLTGTEHDHHVGRAVATASAAAGRRLIDITCGLTAYAYLTSGNCSHSNNGETSAPAISNGSLVDKLTGLHQALQDAKRHAPSVLLLHLDRELASAAADHHDRHDHEGRIWSLLTAELSGSTENCCGQRQHRRIPPVVVVLATGRPLNVDGPLRQRLVRESLELSLPDDAYISGLCCQRDDSSSDESVLWESELLPLLRGRPAEEIVRLWKEYLSSANGDHVCKEDGPTTLLQALCQRHDRQRRRIESAHVPTVRWSDVGGLDHVRAELLDALEIPLLHPQLGIKCGRGLLLFGPPGTGKTMVAKAVATECNLPFLSIKGPELLGSYVGETEGNLRDMFARARAVATKNQPPASIIFFDEIDSLAPRRGGQSSGGNVMDRVVATLFSELDESFEECTVFFMGATNRPDLLDPALLRPGRLDRLVYLGVPSGIDEQARILQTHLEKLRLEGDASEMAKAVTQTLSPGLTGADLSTIASNALLSATERVSVSKLPVYNLVQLDFLR